MYALIVVWQLRAYAVIISAEMNETRFDDDGRTSPPPCDPHQRFSPGSVTATVSSITQSPRYLAEADMTSMRSLSPSRIN